jgi:hypothetical protein
MKEKAKPQRRKGVGLDGVEPVAGKPLEELAVVAHQPDDELALRGNAGIDAGALECIKYTK